MLQIEGAYALIALVDDMLIGVRNIFLMFGQKYTEILLVSLDCSDQDVAKPKDANYIAINPLVNFPETSKKNNWKALRTPLGIKPLSLRFVKDIEDPGRNQLFFNPITDFNAYDGITIGVRLFNGRLKKQLFNYEFSPHYTFLEKSWVGHFRMGTYFYNNYFGIFNIHN